MPQISDEPISERFARDIANHQMEIRHCDGLFRHVVFKQPDTCNMMFSLTTTPGRLIYAGDMGCFVFQRLDDMFEFFKMRGPNDTPNLGYWHEKLIATDRNGSLQPSVEKFRENLQSYDTDDLTEEQIEAVREFIETAVEEYENDGPEVAYRSVNDFSLDEHPRDRRQFFTDFFECSDTVYTFRFRWACHAIQWGVEKFRKNS